MIKRQTTFMIGLRPKGSTTYTPCSDPTVSRATDAYANFFALKDRAEEVCNQLKDAYPQKEFQIFEFREVGYTASIQG